jgi:fructose-1,6-bisphosphatase I
MSNFITTLNRFIVEQQRKFPHATGAFTRLLSDIALAAKIISYHVNKAGLVDILGTAGSVNVHGESQQKLDVFAHETLYKAVIHGGQLCGLGSEESEEIMQIPDDYPRGKYIALFDPLDGSSNIEANVSIGTIFSILRRVSPDGGSATREDFLQPGYKQVCAGYVIYGSSTMMVYTTGAGVHGFTLDPSYGEFVLSHPNIQIPKKGKIYSVNESNYIYWEEGLQRYINYIKEEDKSTNRPYKARYIGSMVADVHRTLLYGGIFMYPGDKKSPKGKLRLLYEANPMAFIVEQAGGKASNGHQRILEVVPEELHERTPVFIGSEEDVTIVEEFIQGRR